MVDGVGAACGGGAEAGASADSGAGAGASRRPAAPVGPGRAFCGSWVPKGNDIASINAAARALWGRPRALPRAGLGVLPDAERPRGAAGCGCVTPPPPPPVPKAFTHHPQSGARLGGHAPAERLQEGCGHTGCGHAAPATSGTRPPLSSTRPRPAASCWPSQSHGQPYSRLLGRAAARAGKRHGLRSAGRPHARPGRPPPLRTGQPAPPCHHRRETVSRRERGGERGAYLPPARRSTRFPCSVARRRHCVAARRHLVAVPQRVVPRKVFALAAPPRARLAGHAVAAVVGGRTGALAGRVGVLARAAVLRRSMAGGREGWWEGGGRGGGVA